MRILVTGACGAIGAPVTEFLLARGEYVRAFDRQQSLSGSEALVGDLTDAEAVREAVSGMDAVVHLGAEPRDTDFPLLVPPNVLGVFHLLDAMRNEGVRRVVLASSIQVLRPGIERYDNTPHHRSPGNYYALTKVFAEEMGAMYAAHFGLEVIAARIGFMVRDSAEAEIMQSRRMFDRYVSRGDMGRFCHAAVSAVVSGFTMLYAVGPDGIQRFDLETARRAIGYQPEDAWPQGLPFAPPLEENLRNR